MKIVPKYSFCDIKKIFTGEFFHGCEPELTLHMYGKEYMIIFYENACSFQRCGYKDGSGEIFYNSLEDLYNTKTIDNILLKRDWNDIAGFECHEWDF